MSNFTVKGIKTLREQTGAGYMDCKDALSGSNGDINKAIILLRQKGVEVANKKSARLAYEGFIGSYIHADGKIGVMVEISCETDFAATTKVFRDFVKDISMHIAAINPSYIDRSEIPKEIIESEKSILYKQMENSDKPAAIIEKIVRGRIDKFYRDYCLMDQTYYRDSAYTVKDIFNQCIAKIGENIIINRFVRYETGA